MERYFYFGEATVETTGEACMFPLSSFLGMSPTGAEVTTMFFAARNGTAFDDTVAVNHVGATPKEFMKEVAGYLQANSRNPFLVVVDGVNNIFATSNTDGVTVTTAA
tara:strand:+ start:79 stop:399 length:321 start_codon:yes stop_codon:yes gene_type:complete